MLCPSPPQKKKMSHTFFQNCWITLQVSHYGAIEVFLLLLSWTKDVCVKDYGR